MLDCKGLDNMVLNVHGPIILYYTFCMDMKLIKNKQCTTFFSFLFFSFFFFVEGDFFQQRNGTTVCIRSCKLLQNNQELLLLVIISCILVAFMFESGLILQREIRLYSLLGVKGVS